MTVNNSDQVVVTVAVGDLLTVVAAAGNAQPVIAIEDGGSTPLAEIAAGATLNEAIDASDPSDIRVFVQSAGDTATVSCVVNGANASGGASTTEDVQRAFTSQQMMSHLSGLYDGVHRSTSGVLNGGGTNSVSAKGLFLQTFGQSEAAAKTKLNVWVSGKITSFDGDSFDGLTGDVNGGVDYQVEDGVVVGVAAGIGRADFDTQIGTVRGSLESTSLTIGLYGAARVADTLTVDGIVSFSFLDYDVASGTTTGGFDATRFGISVGVYNDIDLGGVILQPHARLTYGHEEQDAYTDSIGTARPSVTVNAGRVRAGPKLILPTEGGFTPWFSADAVYEFSDSGTLATGAPDFDDTFSASLGLGFDLSTELGALSAETTLGGLGSGLYTSIGGRLTYALKF
ncbi:MAG: autotransporter outer membrane beta-barrel domain-containing protein [Pseudomonadota bacterium]